MEPLRQRDRVRRRDPDFDRQIGRQQVEGAQEVWVSLGLAEPPDRAHDDPLAGRPRWCWPKYLEIDAVPHHPG
jgi:hypothetical protein